MELAEGSYKDKEKEQHDVVWWLKHINELVAVQIAVNFVFKFDESLCGKCEYKRIA